MYYIERAMSAVVSVRIPEELKETLKKYGVKASEVARQALEEEVERRRMEEAKRAAGELADFLEDIPDEEIVRSIREDREKR